MVMHAKIKVFGRVQGVFFRDAAKKKAEELVLTGFVKNEFGGDSVYIEAEGEKKNLEEFIRWCRKGPAFAMVQSVSEEFISELKHYSDFKAY